MSTASYPGLCRCGCGQSATFGTYASRACASKGKFKSDLPRSKPCEHCGRTFGRDDRKSPYSDAKWIAKKYCGRACSNAAQSERLKALAVEEHPAFKGEEAAVETGRSRARRQYPDLGACERCGEPARERHHRNEDTLDNGPENIEMLCGRCHRRHHKLGVSIHSGPQRTNCWVTPRKGKTPKIGSGVSPMT